VQAAINPVHATVLAIVLGLSACSDAASAEAASLEGKLVQLTADTTAQLLELVATLDVLPSDITSAEAKQAPELTRIARALAAHNSTFQELASGPRGSEILARSSLESMFSTVWNDAIEVNGTLLRSAAVRLAEAERRFSRVEAAESIRTFADACWLFDPLVVYNYAPTLFARREFPREEVESVLRRSGYGMHFDAEGLEVRNYFEAGIEVRFRGERAVLVCGSMAGPDPGVLSELESLLAPGGALSEDPGAQEFLQEVKNR
jgi:hypothetical protein